jgi:hypothetical protein
MIMTADSETERGQSGWTVSSSPFAFSYRPHAFLPAPPDGFTYTAKTNPRFLVSPI